MPLLHILSPAEQVEVYVREQLMSGRWTGTMPGVIRLESELGVNRNTIETALRQLEMGGEPSPAS